MVDVDGEVTPGQALQAKVEELRALQAAIPSRLKTRPATATNLRAATCKACGARIIWCDTVTGKRMPVDAEPAAGGNVVIAPGRERGSPRATVLHDAPAHAPVHWPHHATCSARDNGRAPAHDERPLEPDR